MYNSGDSTIEFPGTQNCSEMEKWISETLGTKLQTFHNSIVLQFPEETWAQRKPNQIIIEKWPENLEAVLEIYALFNPFVFPLVAKSRILNIVLLIIYPRL